MADSTALAWRNGAMTPTLDVPHRSLRWHDHSFLLPPHEFELLHQIVRAYPESVSIDTLALAFGPSLEDPHASVRVAMTKLRARYQLQPGIASSRAR